MSGKESERPVVQSCSWVKPIYLTSQDILTLEPQTKRDILTHNEQWKKICSDENKAP